MSRKLIIFGASKPKPKVVVAVTQPPPPPPPPPPEVAPPTPLPVLLPAKKPMWKRLWEFTLPVTFHLPVTLPVYFCLALPTCQRELVKVGYKPDDAFAYIVPFIVSCIGSVIAMAFTYGAGETIWKAWKDSAQP